MANRSNKNTANIDVNSLAHTLKAARRRTPPVHLWSPPFCGNLDMRIARDGTWFYLGTPIGRPELVKLFSSVIRKDGDDYFLVTPMEKVGINVDDAPFVAVDFEASGHGRAQILTFVTQVEDYVVADSAHPIRVSRCPKTGEPSPYILVRRNLEALIDRKSFYRLVDVCYHYNINGVDWFGVWSSRVFFPLILSRELLDDLE